MNAVLTGLYVACTDPQRGEAVPCMRVRATCCTHMGFPLRGLSSHEGVGHAVLRAPLPVAGLVVALELAGAPAVVQRAVATALLAQLDVIVDHLVGVCAETN